MAFGVPATGSSGRATLHVVAPHFGAAAATLALYPEGSSAAGAGYSQALTVLTNSFGGYVPTSVNTCPAGTVFEGQADDSGFQYQSMCSPWYCRALPAQLPAQRCAMRALLV